MFACFTPIRKALARLLLLMSVIWLAACNPNLGGPISGGPGGGTVPVALLVPSNSGQSGDDLIAQSLENAARLAMRDLQGVTIDLRVYSTASNPTIAADAARQAVADGAAIILGPVYAANANSAGTAVASSGVNLLAFSNNTEIAGGNVFVLGPTFKNTAQRLIAYAASQGKSRIVIVHGEDVAGQLGRSSIAAAAAGSSASVVGSVAYPLSQQGVVDAVPSIIAAARTQNADAIFLTAPTASALPLLTQLLPEAGLDPAVTQFIGLTRWDIPAQTLSLPGVQGGWFALPDQARASAFSSRYLAAYGVSPHPIAGLAFDGIAAIGALAARGGPIDRNALTQGAGFQGASGIFRLTADGANQRGLAVATISNQQVVVISPAPQSFTGSGF